jgi:hypothetical protein
MPRRIFDGSETEFVDWCQNRTQDTFRCLECEEMCRPAHPPFRADSRLAHYQWHCDADYDEDVDRKVAEERG